MSAAIAIFAKTPGLSPVKTRLAASIGKEKAEQFYRLCLEVAEELALSARKYSTPYWAIAEESGLNDPLWQNLDRMWTGEGGLGERLHHVYSTLRKNYGTVLLIGTDSPQLSVQHIKKAISHLTKHSGITIGKALDGGFYLFGGNVDIPREVWVETPYSVSSTCEVLMQKLAAQNDIHTLGELTDIDIIENLYTLLHSRASMTLPNQQKLLHWTDQLVEHN